MTVHLFGQSSQIVPRPRFNGRKVTSDPHLNRGLASWQGSMFVGDNRVGNRFDNLDLSHSFFIRTNLERASFCNSRLFQSHFQEANLTRAKFYGADCTEADFSGAVMKGARLQDADLSQALHLDHANLQGAIWNEGTRFPQWLTPEVRQQYGMVKETRLTKWLRKWGY